MQLRQSIGLVQQEPFLFNATIAENIAWGFGEQISFRQIVEAAGLPMHMIYYQKNRWL
jgi:ABC-type multidrug transport system fused ATPase/permease subunit